MFEKNEFIIFESNQKVKHKILFKDIKKLSKLIDSSWEITTKSGLKYRFKALTEYENKIWYELLSDKTVFLNHFTNEQIETSIALNDQKAIEISTNTFNVQVDLKKSNPNFYHVFEDNILYEIQIDELGYLFKNATKKDVFLNAGIIKRFGLVENYFLIELGRNLDYGPGLIFLKANQLNHIEIHKKMHRLTKIKFSCLFQKVLQSIHVSKLNLNEDNLPCVLPIHVEKNKLNDKSLITPQDSTQVFSNKTNNFSDKIDPMLLEKKLSKILVSNERIGTNKMYLNKYSRNHANFSFDEEITKGKSHLKIVVVCESI